MKVIKDHNYPWHNLVIQIKTKLLRYIGLDPKPLRTELLKEQDFAALPFILQVSFEPHKLT